MNIAYEIRITKDDIKRGLPLRPHRCPIALAARRGMALSDQQSVFARTGMNELLVREGSREIASFYLPMKARWWALRFDLLAWWLPRFLLRPFTFTVERVW